MEQSEWVIVPTNSPHLVPDHAPRPSTPDPAHALQKTTDHAARPQMTQAHEDDDDQTLSPRTAAVAPKQTHCPSQHAMPAVRSAADVQKAGWTVGRRKNLDDMWTRAVDGAGVHRHHQTKKGPVRRRKR